MQTHIELRKRAGDVCATAPLLFILSYLGRWYFIKFVQSCEKYKARDRVEGPWMEQMRNCRCVLHFGGGACRFIVHSLTAFHSNQLNELLKIHQQKDVLTY